MTNLIVTSGQSFTDIDALACAVAYAELLRLEGNAAEAVLPGPLNHSIMPTMRAWKLSYVTKPTLAIYQSIVVDVSEPKHIAVCVFPDSIIEIYDHRYGFQDVWNKKLGAHAHIELVGSCATLVWEQFEKRGYTDR